MSVSVSVVASVWVLVQSEIDIEIIKIYNRSVCQARRLSVFIQSFASRSRRSSASGHATDP